MVRRICARKEPWKLKGRVLQLDADDGSGSREGLRGMRVDSFVCYAQAYGLDSIIEPRRTSRVMGGR